MNRFSLFIRQTLASFLIFLLSACAEEPLGGNDLTGKGHTVTLRLAASVAPIPETKASIQPARSGNETAGFYYEMVSSDADAGAGTPGIKIKPMPAGKDSSEINFTAKSLATRAPGKLKNVYAFLFTSDGTFNGRADIGDFVVGTAVYIDFVDVKTTTAKNCRLVVVANNSDATTSYSSSTDFGSFSGTYGDFQKFTITNEVNKDEDVPYAGSVIIDQSLSESGVTADVSLTWTLAKIMLDNTLFEIEGGPERSNITLYNGGERRFATPGADDYEGTGNTQTAAFLPSIDGGNKVVTTWYVGENIRPAGIGISSAADRNSRKAPANACYIQIKSTSVAVPENTSPAIGEEYIPKGGGKSFAYIIYLGRSTDVSDFSLRRHTKYGLTAEVEGTLDSQKELATEDGRVTFSGGAGLAIGRFGGPENFTKGEIPSSDITGSFTKMLLLEPNTSRTTTADTVKKVWAVNSTTATQTETRRFWDWTYIYGITAGGTIGGMDKATGSLYDYCYQLTLGGVAKGSWYVPTQAQLQTIRAVSGDMKEDDRDYAAFQRDGYWTSTEYDVPGACYQNFVDGDVYKRDKPSLFSVRCVRDVPGTETSGSYVTMVNGYPVIDLSELDPLGCVLTSTEANDRRTAINTYTPSNTAPGEIGGNHDGIWNARMSLRYQVMCADHTSLVDWASAHDVCKQYASEGGNAGQWRLPTQRELSMIWVLLPQLNKKDGFTAFRYSNYWSGTEYDATRAWFTIFTTGATYGGEPKLAKFYVRCVRDIL